MVTVGKCCCFDLRTCGIIVGWLGLVSSIGTLAAAIELLDNCTLFFQSAGIDYDRYATVFLAIKSVAQSEIVASVLQIIMNITLLWGTHKGFPSMILPWLIMNLIQLIVGTLLYVISTIALFVVEIPAAGAILLLIGGLAMALYIYIWISIYSLYRKLKADRINDELNLPLYNTLQNY